MLTVVMYHYVRDPSATRFPRIKGLATGDFEGQLDYITSHYSVCAVRDVVEAIEGKGKLASNACLLTFDDGFIDHYSTVFPRLTERGLPASFYPSARPILEHKVLDVHKIHFILASVENPKTLLSEVLTLLEQQRKVHEIPDDDLLFRTYSAESRYDPEEVVFLKRFLQCGEPEALRSGLVDTLFSRHVSEDETGFAKELYMDLAQLRCMARHGMDVGGHGYDHRWLDKLQPAQQEEEIRETIDFLKRVHDAAPSDWVMCYPYGSYDTRTLQLLQQADCAFALTTQVALIPDLSRPYELGRLDTNDLPFSGKASVADWTLKATSEKAFGPSLAGEGSSRVPAGVKQPQES